MSKSQGAHGATHAPQGDPRGAPALASNAPAVPPRRPVDPLDLAPRGSERRTVALLVAAPFAMALSFALFDPTSMASQLEGGGLALPALAAAGALLALAIRAARSHPSRAAQLEWLALPALVPPLYQRLATLFEPALAPATLAPSAAPSLSSYAHELVRRAAREHEASAAAYALGVALALYALFALWLAPAPPRASAVAHLAGLRPATPLAPAHEGLRFSSRPALALLALAALTPAWLVLRDVDTRPRDALTALLVGAAALSALRAVQSAALDARAAAPALLVAGALRRDALRTALLGLTAALYARGVELSAAASERFLSSYRTHRDYALLHRAPSLPLRDLTPPLLALLLFAALFASLAPALRRLGAPAYARRHGPVLLGALAAAVALADVGASLEQARVAHAALAPLRALEAPPHVQLLYGEPNLSALPVAPVATVDAQGALFLRGARDDAAAPATPERIDALLRERDRTFLVLADRAVPYARFGRALRPLLVRGADLWLAVPYGLLPRAAPWTLRNATRADGYEGLRFSLVRLDGIHPDRYTPTHRIAGGAVTTYAGGPYASAHSPSLEQCTRAYPELGLEAPERVVLSLEPSYYAAPLAALLPVLRACTPPRYWQRSDEAPQRAPLVLLTHHEGLAP